MKTQITNQTIEHLEIEKQTKEVFAPDDYNISPQASDNIIDLIDQRRSAEEVERIMVQREERKQMAEMFERAMDFFQDIKIKKADNYSLNQPETKQFSLKSEIIAIAGAFQELVALNNFPLEIKGIKISDIKILKNYLIEDMIEETFASFQIKYQNENIIIGLNQNEAQFIFDPNLIDKINPNDLTQSTAEIEKIELMIPDPDGKNYIYTQIMFHEDNYNEIKKNILNYCSTQKKTEEKILQAKRNILEDNLDFFQVPQITEEDKIASQKEIGKIKAEIEECQTQLNNLSTYLEEVSRVLDDNYDGAEIIQADVNLVPGSMQTADEYEFLLAA